MYDLEVVFFLSIIVSRICSAIYVDLPIPNQQVDKFQEFSYNIPSKTFLNSDNSTIYLSINENKWVRTSFLNAKIESTFNYIIPQRIVVVGNICYAILYGYGFAIIDISDKEYYVLLGKLTLLNPYDFFIDGEYAYLGFEEGLNIISIKDKNNPVVVGEFSTDYGVFGLDYEDSLVYLAVNRKGLYIVNITNKENPVELGYLYYFNSAGLAVKNKFVYFANGVTGFAVINATISSQPYEMNVFPVSKALDVTIQGNYSYMANSWSGMKIFNISFPELTAEIGEIDTGSAYTIAVSGDFAFVADGDEGTKVIDISNKANPILIQSIDTYSNCYGVFVEGDVLYASEYKQGLKIYNISNITNSKLISSDKHYGGTPTSAFFDGNGYVYIADYTSGGIKIFDVKNPKKPKRISVKGDSLSPLLSPKRIVVGEDGYTYITDYSSKKFVIYNISIISDDLDLSSPPVVSYNEISSITVSKLLLPMFIFEDYAFVGEQSAGDVYIINITNRTDPVVVHSSQLCLGSQTQGIFSTGNYTYLACSIVPGGIRVYDTKDKSNPIPMGSLTTLDAQDIIGDEYDKNILYIADGSDGVKILNISDPSNPTTVGSCDTFKALRVKVVGDFAFVADGTAGVKVIDISTKNNPIVLLSIDTLNTANDVFVKDNYIYVADNLGLILISMDISVLGTSDFAFFCGDLDIEVVGKDYKNNDVKEIFTVSRSDYCNRHGVCQVNYECSCEKGYTGDYCNSWSCIYDYKIVGKTCSGHGRCIAPDTCDCQSQYIGKMCQTSLLYYTVMTPSLVFVTVFTIIGLIICCCCLCVLVCIFFFCLALCVLGLSVVVVRQMAGLKKFGKLRNFDMLLKEQEMDDDVSVAHMRFKKDLFLIDIKDIKTISVIGEGGSNSVVFKVLWKGRVTAAFKCFKTRSLLGNQDRFDEFEKELEIISSLSHPNIVRFYGACLKPPRVGILMEFCKYGEILDFVVDYRKQNMSGYPIFEKFRLFIDVIIALEFLHSKKIIHRDLKCGNVLISSSDNIPTAKLMDFGLSRTVDRMSASKTRNVGTNLYMSPEILMGEYNEKCDIFSFAMMCYILITENKEPYDDIVKGGGGFKMFNIELKVANDPLFRPKLEHLKLPDKTSNGLEN